MAVTTQTGLRVRDLICPNCQAKGRAEADHWLCGSCGAEYQFRVLCDVCSQTVDRIRACGGFEEYFCNQCNAPKSKSKVVFEFSEKES